MVLTLTGTPKWGKDRMLDEATISATAQQLHEAEKNRAPIRQLSLQHPEMTIADAYAIQRALVALKLDEGRTVKGHKIGLTSRAMQLAVGIDEPDYGVLLNDMFRDDGSDVPTEKFIAPRIEVELAFVLKRALRGTDCTIFDVYNATDFVVPAFEILDARIQRLDPETKSPRKVVDTIADNAGNAALILGGRPMRPDDVDMRWISALCLRNGRIEETGVAAGVLNHPANGIAWLVNKLSLFDVALEPGHVVLSGSFTRPLDASSGDVFFADFGPHGSVSCRFS